MNYYQLFYWLTVADSLKDVMWGFAIASSILFCVVAFAMLVDSDLRTPITKRWRMGGLIMTVLCFLLYAFTPTKKDSLLIIAGGGTMEYLTSDSTAKQIPHELSNFVVSELHSMASEAKLDIMTSGYKKQILDKAKNMTGEQLIEAMKDTSFANIILDK